MDEIIHQRIVMREWWNDHHKQYKLEKSIKKIYSDFSLYAKNLPPIVLEKFADKPPKTYDPINEFIFRTYIRKHGGYNNSSSNMQAYYDKIDEKRRLRKIRKYEKKSRDSQYNK